MWRIKRFVQLVILRKYWIRADTGTETHVWPNNDLRRHELIDCPCGPTDELVHGEDGDEWQTVHHSLDGRELKELA
jgi:hypothetical protein